MTWVHEEGILESKRPAQRTTVNSIVIREIDSQLITSWVVPGMKSVPHLLRTVRIVPDFPLSAQQRFLCSFFLSSSREGTLYSHPRHSPPFVFPRKPMNCNRLSLLHGYNSRDPISKRTARPKGKPSPREGSIRRLP